MIDDLAAQLDALGEDDFYYSPATTKAKINKAIAALKSQAARIAKLEAALNQAKQHFMANEPLKAFIEICAALTGGGER